MTTLRLDIMEACRDNLISSYDAINMMNVIYVKESDDSIVSKIKDAWETFKKWLRDIINKILGRKINNREVQVQKYKFEALQNCQKSLSKAASRKFNKPDDTSNTDVALDNLLDAADYFTFKTEMNSETIKTTVQEVHDLVTKIHKDCDKITSNAEEASDGVKKAVMRSIRTISKAATSIDNQCVASDNVNYSKAARVAYQALFMETIPQYKTILNTRIVMMSRGKPKELNGASMDPAEIKKRNKIVSDYVMLAINLFNKIDADTLTARPAANAPGPKTDEEKQKLQEELERGNAPGNVKVVLNYAKTMVNRYKELESITSAVLKNKDPDVYDAYMKVLTRICKNLNQSYNYSPI